MMCSWCRSRYRLTRIAVDNEAGPYKNHTVVFLGSEKGIILKFLAKMNNGILNDSLFLEELNVYNPDKYVEEIQYMCVGEVSCQSQMVCARGTAVLNNEAKSSEAGLSQ